LIWVSSNLGFDLGGFESATKRLFGGGFNLGVVFESGRLRIGNKRFFGGGYCNRDVLFGSNPKISSLCSVGSPISFAASLVAPRCSSYSSSFAAPLQVVVAAPLQVVVAVPSGAHLLVSFESSSTFHLTISSAAPLAAPHSFQVWCRSGVDVFSSSSRYLC
jgi:hypothetical protein